MWKLPSPTCPTIGVRRPFAAASARLSSMHSASREIGTQTSVARPSAPGLSELGDRLGGRLDTRVKVALGRSKGRISIEFASLADLERIVSVIDPRNREDRPI